MPTKSQISAILSDPTLSREAMGERLMALLSQEKEEVKDECRWWKPKVGEMFSYITFMGEITDVTWCGSDADKRLCSNLNCFQTKEDAELANRFRIEHMKSVMTSEIYPSNGRDEYVEMIKRHMAG